MLAANLVYGARRALFGFAFGDAALLVRILDVLVLSISLAAFFDSAWHIAFSLLDRGYRGSVRKMRAMARRVRRQLIWLKQVNTTTPG
jgi:hypothetical protein